MVWECGVILPSSLFPAKVTVVGRASAQSVSTDRLTDSHQSINQLTLRCMIERFLVPADFLFGRFF